MKDKYIDLIEQTFDFPQDEFTVEDNELNFHDIPLMELIKQYGTPLKITYLPKISQQINRAKRMFNVAMAKVDYKGTYNYCYCTKSSHFSFVLEEAMKNDIHLETSSAYDIHIINALYDSGVIDKDRYIICNGFKRPQYVENIAQLINDGFENTIPVIDNKEEIDLYDDAITQKCKIGIRIASEEEPKFEFYTSRLGIRGAFEAVFSWSNRSAWRVVPRRSASGTGCCRAYCSDYSGRSDSDCSGFAGSRWRRIERMPPTSERPAALPTAKSTEFFSTPSETSEYVRANRGKDSKKSGFRCFIGISRAHAEPANRRHDDI